MNRIKLTKDVGASVGLAVLGTPVGLALGYAVGAFVGCILRQINALAILVYQ